MIWKIYIIFWDLEYKYYHVIFDHTTLTGPNTSLKMCVTCPLWAMSAGMHRSRALELDPLNGMQPSLTLQTPPVLFFFLSKRLAWKRLNKCRLCSKSLSSFLGCHRASSPLALIQIRHSVELAAILPQLLSHVHRPAELNTHYSNVY